MTTSPSNATITTWNIFAAELQGLLVAHGEASLWSLQRAGIHPESINRLRRSLTTPKAFPILNSEELNRVRETFGLSVGEHQRLMAAIMAASVEKHLMNRVNIYLAYEATQRIFVALTEVMQQDSLLATLERGTLMEEQEELVTVALTTAGIFPLLDQAAFDLHISQYTTSPQEALMSAHLALGSLQRAQSLFVTLPATVAATDAARYWQHNIDNAIMTATRQVHYLTTGVDL